jgi:hypothetical protein
MAICLKPPPFVTGLARGPNGSVGDGASIRFREYQRHTAPQSLRDPECRLCRADSAILPK